MLFVDQKHCLQPSITCSAMPLQHSRSVPASMRKGWAVRPTFMHPEGAAPTELTAPRDVYAILL